MRKASQAGAVGLVLAFGWSAKAQMPATPSQCAEPATAAISTPTVNPPATPPSVTPGHIFTDAKGNVWSLTAQGTVTENGKAAGYTAEVSQIVVVNGILYQETTFGEWWGWDGSKWLGVSGDPTKGTPVMVTTVANDVGQNFALPDNTALTMVQAQKLAAAGQMQWLKRAAAGQSRDRITQEGDPTTVQRLARILSQLGSARLDLSGQQ
jgi:hypothetical protein